MNLRPSFHVQLLTAAVSFLLLPSIVNAQAFCALRDPIKIIQQFEPEATGHKSVVKVVRGGVRNEVAERLPFTLHFNELGKHTVYVILKGEEPAGIIHARSEKGNWGMVEIVWYLDMDLRVKDFAFQRCRDRAKKEIGAAPFTEMIHGKGFKEIRSMLNEDGSALSEKVAGSVSEKAADLALTTIRSALKTITVTDLVWLSDLKEAGSTVPDPIKDQVGNSLIKVEEVYTDGVLNILNSLDQDDEWILNRKSVIVNRVYSKDKDFLGLTIFMECTADITLVKVNWDVNPEGGIRSVSPKEKWPSPDIEEAFQNLENFTLKQASTCSTPGQLAAVEVLAISKVLLNK